MMNASSELGGERRRRGGPFVGRGLVLAGLALAVAAAGCIDSGHNLGTPHAGSGGISGLGGEMGSGGGTGGMTLEGTGGVGGVLGTGGMGGVNAGSGIAYPTGASPSAIAIGDLNGDGMSDLAVVNRGGGAAGGIGAISVLLNAGGGRFPARSSYGAFTAPSALAASDLDGDGKLDLVVVDAAAPGIIALFNDGNGAFSTQSPLTTVGYPTGLAIGDLDGQGGPDIAISDLGVGAGAGPRVLLNAGGRQLTPLPGYDTVDCFMRTVAIGDLDGDGRPDLATTCEFGVMEVRVFLGDSAGGFAAAAKYAVSYYYAPRSIAIADLDRDGQLDVVIGWAGHDSSPGAIGVLRNLSAGALAPVVWYGAGAMDSTTTTAGPPGTGPDGFALADFDGDGVLDVAAANSGGATATSNVGVLRGKPDGSFAAPVIYEDGGRPNAIAAGDLDGDGRPDIAVTDGTSGTVTVFLNVAR